MVVEGAVDFCEEKFEVEGLVSLVSGVLADGADESFVTAGGIDANEIEDLSLVQLTFLALKVTHP